MHTNIAVVGGGIIGLATAYELTRRHADRTVTVLEKEDALARHQTGHNSGVLHSGVYYKPGSLKAANCRAGKQAMEAFCAEHEIAYEICGKVIVAVDDAERPALERIYERGRANGVACELIGVERLSELEPHAAGVQALHVPEAGIVNFRQVCEKLADLVRQRDGRVMTGAAVKSIERRGDLVALETAAGHVTADYVVNCAGLHSDRIARMAGAELDVRIVPFRGEYYQLKPESRALCRNLIYPVPDPKFPFLGVHFTRMIDGSVECGPNAVLALAREGYGKLSFHPRDALESLTYGGFLRLAARHWKMGMGEMHRSLSKPAFVKALQRLMPEVTEERLTPARAGVRAQAVGRDGRLIDDFLIEDRGRMVHVLNAPSPAATSALNIGKLVVDKLARRF